MRTARAAVCRLQSALGSLPSVALSSAGAKGEFPVSVSFRVYREGNGQWEFELVAAGIMNDFAAGGEFSQGGADFGGANAAEFLHLLNGDRFLELGQGLAHSFRRSGKRIRLNRGAIDYLQGHRA